MQPPTFAQPERKSYALPIVIAIAVLAAALVALYHGTKTSLTATLLRTETLPSTTVYKSETIVVGPPETSYTLFVVCDVRIANQRTRPITLDDVMLNLTDSHGAQLTASALRPQELASAELSFPKLKPMVNAPLLVRDTPIAPNQSAEGKAVFSLAVPQSVWERRTSAVVALTPYHLDPIPLTIPIK